MCPPTILKTCVNVPRVPSHILLDVLSQLESRTKGRGGRHLSRAAQTPSAASRVTAAVASIGATGMPSGTSPLLSASPSPAEAEGEASADSTAARGTGLMSRAAKRDRQAARACAAHWDSIAGATTGTADFATVVVSAGLCSVPAVDLAVVARVDLQVGCGDADCSWDDAACVVGAVLGFAVALVSDEVLAAGAAGLCAAGGEERGALEGAGLAAAAASREGGAAGFAAAADGAAPVCTVNRAAEARAAAPISGAGALADGVAALWSAADGTLACSRKRCSEARALAPCSGAGGLALCAPRLGDGAGGAVWRTESRARCRQRMKFVLTRPPIGGMC